jgi:hypothetical protein
MQRLAARTTEYGRRQDVSRIRRARSDQMRRCAAAQPETRCQSRLDGPRFGRSTDAPTFRAAFLLGSSPAGARPPLVPA